jgi:uncharacterized protein YndB with AHSA1/START domain
MMALVTANQVTVEERIAASPQVLYDLVSDVTAMGRWSPETQACRWLDGADGPTVGARFKGTNKDGWRKWTTTCTVVAAEPGRRFEFDVVFGGLPVSRWTYEFTADGDATLVTERWSDRRARWMVRVSPYVMGVRDRADHNREGMVATLAGLRRGAERASVEAVVDTTSPPPEVQALLRRAYTAFNERDIDAALVLAHGDVDWPDMIDGGRIQGHDAVRAYWERQFAVTAPHVEPQTMAMDQDGRAVVVVHQVVRDLDGAVLVDECVHHVYTVRDGLIARMDVT